MILAALYITFVMYTVVAIHGKQDLFADFPHGKRTPRLLIAVQSTTALATLFLAVGFFPPALLTPIPVFAVIFLFPILLGRSFTREYQNYGTSETAPLESICTSVMWSGIFGVVHIAIAFIHQIALHM